MSRTRCGTCRYWAKQDDPPHCNWKEPALPFWAHISNGDHGDYTEADQGQRCPAWLPKQSEGK